jgi:hypothetical protein
MKLPKPTKTDRERLAPHLRNYHKTRTWIKSAPSDRDVAAALWLEATGPFRNPVIDLLTATLCKRHRAVIIDEVITASHASRP